MFTNIKKLFVPVLVSIFSLTLFFTAYSPAFLQGTAVAVPQEPLQVQAPPASAALQQEASFSEYQLQVEIDLHNRGDNQASNIRLEVPLLGNLDSPYQVMVQENYSIEPVEVIEEAMGSRTALFTIDSLPAGESKTITLLYGLEARPLAAVSSSFADVTLTEYLEPSRGLESDHPSIISRAGEITSNSSSDKEQARKIYAFVLDHMTYDAESPHRNQGALNALEHGIGVCEDYASLFVALARAADLPARQVNGYADPKATGEIWKLAPGQAFSLQGYRHSWAEVYLEGEGWLPLDPTMDIYNDSGSFKFFGSLPASSHIAQNYEDNSIRARFQGGQLAVTWSESLIGR